MDYNSFKEELTEDGLWAVYWVDDDSNITCTMLTITGEVVDEFLTGECGCSNCMP